MQQPGAGEQVQYATLGWRAAAVLLDTLIVLIASSVVLAVLMAAGLVDLGVSTSATLNDIVSASRAAPVWLMPVEYSLVFLYFTLFELRGSTPGKRVLRLSVTAEDGQPPSAIAVVVRNLVRIPEMYLLYIPSAISCLISGKRKRLGDYAARTVVLRYPRPPAVHPAARPGPWPVPPPAPGAVPLPAPPPAPPAVPAGPPDLAAAVAALKTAALVVRGAHFNYLRFSELELARAEAAPADAATPAQVADSGGPAAPGTAEPAPSYSPEYASSWYTLADAVIAMQHAHVEAEAAAARADTTLGAACADQPDLAHLFRELGPYFTAASDEEVHEAYLQVARGESLA